MDSRVDLTGKRFGRYVVIAYNGYVGGKTTWKCLCDCGNIKVVRGADLLRGMVLSCGCLKKEVARRTKNVKHGLLHHPLYSTWHCLRVRCGIVQCKDEKKVRLYAGRGIGVCDEWLEFENFYEWSINNGWKKGLQLDRIDNERGYSPSNCHWVTSSENCRNKRNNLRYPNGELLIDVFEKLGFQSYIDHNKIPEYSKAQYEFHKFGTFCIDTPF